MWAIHTQRWDIENDGRQERSITDSVSQPTRPPSHTISSLLFPRSRTGNMPTFLVRPFLLAFLFFIYSSLLRYTHVSWTPIFRVPRRLRMALTTYAYRRTLTRSTSYIIYIYFFSCCYTVSSIFFLSRCCCRCFQFFPPVAFHHGSRGLPRIPESKWFAPARSKPSSLISFVVSSFLLSFFFKNIFIIGTRRGKYEEAAVGGMLGARRQVLQDQRSQSSREREREKTALSPSFVLFFSFFSSSSFHSAHVLHYLQLFHLFLISYNFRV